MEPYNVNNEEYFNGDEFKSIVAFINSIKNQRAYFLTNRNPEYKINHRYHFDNDLTHYMVSYNIPYYDILCETLLHKDGNGYLDLGEFTFQTNCFSKTAFHRLLWPTDKRDTFLDFVVQDWRQNSRFAALEESAKQIFDKSASLLEYHKEFIYNDQYKFVTKEEVRELFDELLEKGLLLSKVGDLYQVYSNLDLSVADTDMKTRWYSGVLTDMDKLHIESTYKSRTLPVLKDMKSKFSLIPANDNGKFEGKWLVHKIDNKIWFIPQYLLFYND